MRNIDFHNLVSSWEQAEPTRVADAIGGYGQSFGGE